MKRSWGSLSSRIQKLIGQAAARATARRRGANARRPVACSNGRSRGALVSKTRCVRGRSRLAPAAEADPHFGSLRGRGCCPRTRCASPTRRQRTTTRSRVSDARAKGDVIGTRARKDRAPRAEARLCGCGASRAPRTQRHRTARLAIPYRGV